MRIIKIVNGYGIHKISSGLSLFCTVIENEKGD